MTRDGRWEVLQCALPLRGSSSSAALRRRELRAARLSACTRRCSELGLEAQVNGDGFWHRDWLLLPPRPAEDPQEPGNELLGWLIPELQSFGGRRSFGGGGDATGAPTVALQGELLLRHASVLWSSVQTEQEHESAEMVEWTCITWSRYAFLFRIMHAIMFKIRRVNDLNLWNDSLLQCKNYFESNFYKSRNEICLSGTFLW